MEEFSYELKVPKDRIAVLIGKEGKLKTELEEQSDAKINIDSKEGDVVVVGKDSLKLFVLRDIIRAISRGFNPDIAMQLLKQDYVFELLNIMDYIKNKEHLPRIRGRVIGKNGKSRETIEELTETKIVVYGKTIGIIGFIDSVAVARRAIESLLEGALHKGVYKALEKQRRSVKSVGGFSI
ncbi:MAG: KH domain-containing protein [Vulcanibacillus sp.]